MAPSMLRAADVAKRLSCHVTTVHRLARSGQLPAVRIGGMVRFKAADVERLEAEGTCRERTEDGTSGATRAQASGISGTLRLAASAPAARARAIAETLSKS